MGKAAAADFVMSTGIDSVYTKFEIQKERINTKQLIAKAANDNYR